MRVIKRGKGETIHIANQHANVIEQKLSRVEQAVREAEKQMTGTGFISRLTTAAAFCERRFPQFDSLSAVIDRRDKAWEAGSKER
jgi:hypothetical protein